jgi:hypothetical protein
MPAPPAAAAPKVGEWTRGYSGSAPSRSMGAWTNTTSSWRPARCGNGRRDPRSRTEASSDTPRCRPLRNSPGVEADSSSAPDSMDLSRSCPRSPRKLVAGAYTSPPSPQRTLAAWSRASTRVRYTPCCTSPVDPRSARAQPRSEHSQRCLTPPRAGARCDAHSHADERATAGSTSPGARRAVGGAHRAPRCLGFDPRCRHRD